MALFQFPRSYSDTSDYIVSSHIFTSVTDMPVYDWWNVAINGSSAFHAHFSKGFDWTIIVSDIEAIFSTYQYILKANYYELHMIKWLLLLHLKNGMFLATLIAGLTILLIRALSNPGLLEVLSPTLVSVRGPGKYLTFFLYGYLVKIFPFHKGSQPFADQKVLLFDTKHKLSRK